MKRYSLILILFLGSNLAFSQVLVDSTKKWNNVLYSEMGFAIASELIRFGKDTLVNSESYKKVLRSTIDFPYNWTEYGFIRETADEKIYYRTDTSDQEYLLYDFNLNPGDTVIPAAIFSMNSGTQLYLQSSPMIVESIDSILIGNQNRRQIHLSPEGLSGMETDQWVEGMGSKSGILHSDFGFVGGDYYRLLCFYQNDSLLYLDPFYSDCFVISSVSKVPAFETPVSVNPNPVKDVSMVSIKNSGDRSITMEVYTFTGEKVMMMEATDGMKIYRNDFIPGMYLFRFTFNSGKTETIKVQIM